MDTSMKDQLRVRVFVLVSVFVWCACNNSAVDLIIEPDAGNGGDTDIDGDTDTGQEDGVDAGEDLDTVVANIQVPKYFDETPLKIAMNFAEVPPMPPNGTIVASGSEYEDPNIGPDVDYFYQSNQADLDGEYALMFVLYVEGGGIDEGVPVNGTDYVGYSFPVTLGPGTGAIWAGSVILENTDWKYTSTVINKSFFSPFVEYEHQK